MYNKTTEEVLKSVNSSLKGLKQTEAKNRLADDGQNEVRLNKGHSFKDKLKSQLNSVVMYVLIFACIVSMVATILYKNTFLLINVVLIFVAMILNVVLGMLSMSKLERTILNVQDKLKPFTTVKRDGKLIKVKTSELVVGDIIYISEGDVVPADVRIVNANNLYICDLVITGETTSVLKTDAIIKGSSLPLGEQNNMAFLGSSVTKGSATCVVVATGTNTRLGKTTGLLTDEIAVKTPLMKKLEKYTEYSSMLVLLISILGLVVNYFRGGSNADAFMMLVNFAVCIVPEGLMISIYVNLNRSISKLYNNNLAIKNLITMEELGAVDVLCVDKLGVVTESKMHVTDVWINNRDDYQTGRNPNFISLCNAMLLCNNAEVVYDGNDINTVGLPYEVALLNYGLYLGYNKDKLEGVCPRVNEFNYDRDRKMMSTINSVGEKSIVFSRGDFLRVLAKCNSVLEEGVAVELTDTKKAKIIHEYQKFIDKGYLVMAFATKEYRGDVYSASALDVESDLTFIGLTAVMPKLKEDVKNSFAKLTKLGVKVILTTSDNPDVTLATALDLGLIKNKSQMLSGEELSKITDTALKVIVNKYSVFSGLVPEQKLRIIKALKQNGKKVCVTGDKVTDVDAMTIADISVGLGVNASEVVKEQAEVVLTDNNIDNLADGINESRRVNRNLNKAVEYSFSSMIAQILLLIVIMIGLNKTFFSPALLLWLNFFNGLLPSLGLGNEKSTISKEPKREKLFGGVTLFNVIFSGVMQAGVVLAVYFSATYYYAYSHEKVIALCFATLSAIELFHAFNLKHEIKSIFTSNPFGNQQLNLNTLLCLFFSFIFLVCPLNSLQECLGVAQLTIVNWISCIGVALVIIPLMEIVKMFVPYYIERKKNK